LKLPDEIRAIRIRQPIFENLAGEERRKHAIARLLSGCLIGGSYQFLNAIPWFCRNTFHGRLLWSFPFDAAQDAGDAPTAPGAVACARGLFHAETRYLLGTLIKRS